MALLSITLLIVAGAAVLSRFVLDPVEKRRYLAAWLLGITALFGVLFAVELWQGIDEMVDARRTAGSFAGAACAGAPCKPYVELSDAAAADQVGMRAGFNASFVAWNNQRLRGRSKFYLVMPSAPGPYAGAAQWITYQMLPNVALHVEGQRGDGKVNRRSSAALARADHVVFYEVDPAVWRRSAPIKLRLVRFGPNYALGRPRR